MNYKEALRLQDGGHSIDEIMCILGVKGIISYGAFQRALNEYRRTGHMRAFKVKGSVTYTDKKEATTEDVKGYYEALKILEKQAERLDTKQTNTCINISDDKPIGIAFWGDWHLGSKGLDYDQFDRDRAMIKEADGLYFIGMGDYKDNNSSYVTKSSNENTIPQGMQDLLVKEMIGQVKNKCLALIRGCHDDWDKKLADKDFISTLCEEADCINMWHGGKLTITLGEQEYEIFARHKYKNESGMNTTNAQRNMLNDAGAVDICALGHKHYPDMQMLDRMGKKVVYFRSGAYKKYDEFGQKIGGFHGISAVPVAVIYPNTHKIVPFQELEDAISFLNAVRGNC